MSPGSDRAVSAFAMRNGQCIAYGRSLCLSPVVPGCGQSADDVGLSHFCSGRLRQRPGSGSLFLTGCAGDANTATRPRRPGRWRPTLPEPLPLRSAWLSGCGRAMEAEGGEGAPIRSALGIARSFEPDRVSRCAPAGNLLALASGARKRPSPVRAIPAWPFGSSGLSVIAM